MSVSSDALPAAASPSLAAKPTGVRFVVLGWACSLSMLTYIDRVCIKQVEGDISRDLGLNPQQFAWVFASFALAYSLFEVPSGLLGDRMGPRKVLTRIVLWWSLFTALTGMVWPFRVELGISVPWFDGAMPLVFDSLVLLVIIRFLFGMGEAGAYPNAARALRNWFPYQRRGFAQGLLWLFARWGGAVAPALIAVCSALFGWRGAFYTFGVIGACWVVFFWFFFRDSPREHPGVNESELAYIEGAKGLAGARLPIAWSSMLASPTLWCLSLMYFCSNAGWCFFITWDKKYYQEVLSMDEKGIPVLIASGAPLFFGGIACLLGGLTTDRMVQVLGRRWGRTLQGLLAYFLGGAFFLIALLLEHPVLSVVFLCLASFVKDFAMGVSWATCLDIGHRYSGTVSGFMNMIGNLGTVVGPLSVAYLAREHGWHLALAFSSAMFFVASLGWAFINPRHVIVYSPADRQRLEELGDL